LDDETMYVQLDLADLDGQVIFAQEPRVSGALTVELYLLIKTYAENQEIYLYGASIPPSEYLGYIGNDLPWSFGVLGSVCTLKIPVARMQVRPVVGDRVRVQVKEYDRAEELVVAPLSLAFARRSDSPYLATLQSRPSQASTEVIATVEPPVEDIPTEVGPPGTTPPTAAPLPTTTTPGVLPTRSPVLTPPVPGSPSATQPSVTPLVQPSPSPTSGTAYPLLTPTFVTSTAYP
jgi:hypothetical protein